MLIGKIANSVIFIPVLCSNAATGVIWRELLNGKIPAVETFWLVWDQGIYVAWKC